VVIIDNKENKVKFANDDLIYLLSDKEEKLEMNSENLSEKIPQELQKLV
jgi:hypothetical protein